MNAAAENLWPEGKRFAFTVFDDTDRATLENVREVYAFLRDLGFRTTKSVWPVGADSPESDGTTCADPVYREWALGLQRAGFEIGFHNATFRTSPRGRTEAGLREFETLFSHAPYTASNHYQCRENVYWGDGRLSGGNRSLYNLLTFYRQRGLFRGHVEGDPCFWGDLCREKIGYMRNFVFGDINTLRACPWMPYTDPSRPYVRAWYASSEGADVSSFLRCVSEANIARLEDEGGACIMYTHFSSGFYADGKLHLGFRAIMERLASKNGWFVPAHKVLDRLKELRGVRELTGAERGRLERKWLWHKIRVGAT